MTSTPDTPKTDHPKRYGGKAPPKSRIHKAEIEPFLTSKIKAQVVERGKKTKKVAKHTQVAVLVAILHHRGWDRALKRPTRDCLITCSKISALLSLHRDTTTLALLALESQRIITKISKGYHVSTEEELPPESTEEELSAQSTESTEEKMWSETTIQGGKDVVSDHNSETEMWSQSTNGGPNHSPPSLRSGVDPLSDLVDSSPSAPPLPRSESANAAAAAKPLGSPPPAFALEDLKENKPTTTNQQQGPISKRREQEMLEFAVKKFGEGNFLILKEEDEEHPYPWVVTNLQYAYGSENTREVLPLCWEVLEDSMRLKFRVSQEDPRLSWDLEEIGEQVNKINQSKIMRVSVNMKEENHQFTLLDYAIALEKRLWEFVDEDNPKGRNERIKNPGGFLRGVVTRDLLSGNSRWDYAPVKFVEVKQEDITSSPVEDDERSEEEEEEEEEDLMLELELDL